MDYKKPKTVDQQIEYLAANKRVVYNEVSKRKAKDILTRYGYINVITPFKYHFAKTDKNGVEIRDAENNHIYERDVDFKEYYDSYINERSEYTKIYENIREFEITFNTIIGREVLLFYKIDSDTAFFDFCSKLLDNINNVSTEKETVKEKMRTTVSGFPNEIAKYDSPFIFMDRLSFNETITVFKNIDEGLRSKIFNRLVKTNNTLGYVKLASFVKMLPKLVLIRNCVYHNNSLTILKRYHKIKEKVLRDRPSYQSYCSLISKLSS